MSHTIQGKGKDPIIGLDKNCMSHSNTHNNEITLRAFKLACLTYKPTPVQYENALYSRNELIQAKKDLMRYALSQLKHLDINNLEQNKFQDMVS